MGNAGRLLLRFVLVPLGYLAAVLASAFVVLFGAWKTGALTLADQPDPMAAVLYAMVIAIPALLVTLFIVWLPSTIGIVIAEAFAIRSWIYHAINGALSSWVGAQAFGDSGFSNLPSNEPRYMIAAGLAGGFAYWAVAGWNAGFWKPVFSPMSAPPA